jgi:hypothetical protein
MQQVIALAKQDSRQFQSDVDDIVSDKTMSPYDQIESALALANAAFTQQQHAHSQHIDKHTVHIGLGKQALFQVLGQQRYECGTLVMTAQQGYIVIFHLEQKVFRGDKAFGDNETADTE